MYIRILVVGLLAMVLFPAALFARSTSDEVPIERCDRLPVVKVRIGSTEIRFLVDTGTTTVLNLESLTAGRVKDIQITSWSATAFTSAREVSISDLTLGTHHLRDLKLPAIDLSPIGNACGGPIDGILGVDLLDKMEFTIDLKSQVASLGDSDFEGPIRGNGKLDAVLCHGVQRGQSGRVRELSRVGNCHVHAG